MSRHYSISAVRFAQGTGVPIMLLASGDQASIRQFVQNQLGGHPDNQLLKDYLAGLVTITGYSSAEAYYSEAGSLPETGTLAADPDHPADAAVTHAKLSGAVVVAVLVVLVGVAIVSGRRA